MTTHRDLLSLKFQRFVNHIFIVESILEIVGKSEMCDKEKLTIMQFIVQAMGDSARLEDGNFCE